MSKKGKTESPNIVIEAMGESKQTIGVRIDNALLAELHKQVALEKELAAQEDWPSPTMTDVVEMLLRKGLRTRSAELRQAEGTRPQR